MPYALVRTFEAVLRQDVLQSWTSCTVDLASFFCMQKPGKWCATHVQIAWEIYYHQQKVGYVAVCPFSLVSYDSKLRVVVKEL